VVVNNLVGYAHTTGDIRIQRDGTQWRPLVSDQDIPAAFLAVLGQSLTSCAAQTAHSLWDRV
jgi:hypothetical protein